MKVLNVKDHLGTDVISHLDSCTLGNIINEYKEEKITLDFKDIILIGPLFHHTLVAFLGLETLKNISIANIQVSDFLLFAKSLREKQHVDKIERGEM